MNESRRQTRCWLRVLFQCVVFFSITARCKASKQIPPKIDPMKSSGDSESSGSPTKVISLAESINRSQRSLSDPERTNASRKQWQTALKEIKELTLPNAKEKTNGEIGRGLFNQWKLLLDEPEILQFDPETNATARSGDSQSPLPIESTVGATSSSKKRPQQRFEGFASWERMLQDWAEDVNEYLEKIETESTDYPMATFGRPATTSPATPESASLSTDTVNAETPTEPQSSVDRASQQPAPFKALGSETDLPEVKLGSSKNKYVQVPVPKAAQEGEDVLPYTDIRDKAKKIWIVTTAALPWMTGTAVNPLLRAANMVEGRKSEGGSVTLMLPWLERVQDQEKVYGDGRRFTSQEEQESFIRDWLRDKAKLLEASIDMRIEWYTSWQNTAENSLYSMGDITAQIPADEVDIMILEEPEHLNWYRAPGEASWTDKFKHVIGIIHTNYFVYAAEQPGAFIRAPGMRLLCSWMCRAHCHRVIKLSGTLGQFAPEKELVENVHGVRDSFLETGSVVRSRLAGPGAATDTIFGANADPTVYFIGKMLWSKGLGSLMELLKYADESAGIKVKVDMFGGGPDQEAARNRATELDVGMDFRGPLDHGDLGLSHKIFINPSTSEVLCTTVAEALAMGKFVIVPSHPSNDFFAQFPNTLTYTNKEEFVGDLYYALTHSPEPISEAVSYALSWKAATERLEAAGSIPVKEAERMAHILESRDAGIEISLPSFIEDERSRKLWSAKFENSRDRFRQFRSKLAEEIDHSFVLPDALKYKMIGELDKRLDIDIEDVLENPKLQIQLSPAELDSRLLDLFKLLSKGPSGDVFRVIAGGQDVAFQDLYIKRRAARARVRNPLNSTVLGFAPAWDFDDSSDSLQTTPSTSQWVQRTLNRNLPKTRISPTSDLEQEGSRRGSDKSQRSKSDTSMRMSFTLPHHARMTSRPTAHRWPCPQPRSLFTPSRLDSRSCVLLI